MALKYLKETTTDWNAPFRVPCHTYILDGDKCVGYIKEGTEQPIMFNKPSNFDKRKRTFKQEKNIQVDIEPNDLYSKSSMGTTTGPSTNFSNPRGKNMSKSKTLSWNDRFALIDHFTPSDDEACNIFGVTKDELATARNMKATGAIVPTPDIDFKSYNKMFGITTAAKPGSKTGAKTKTTSGGSVTTSDNTPSGKKSGATSISKPQTANKPVKEPKKRGRKGDNIVKAFKAIPAQPTPVEDFAKANGVSVAVLRQSKRFDQSGEEGRVHVKKDKATQTLMIWRSADV